MWYREPKLSRIESVIDFTGGQRLDGTERISKRIEFCHVDRAAKCV